MERGRRVTERPTSLPREFRPTQEWREILAGTTETPWKAVAGGSITGPNGENIGEWGNATLQDMMLVTVAREAVEEVIRVRELYDGLLERLITLSEGICDKWAVSDESNV